MRFGSADGRFCCLGEIAMEQNKESISDGELRQYPTFIVRTLPENFRNWCDALLLSIGKDDVYPSITNTFGDNRKLGQKSYQFVFFGCLVSFVIKVEEPEKLLITPLIVSHMTDKEARMERLEIVEGQVEELVEAMKKNFPPNNTAVSEFGWIPNLSEGLNSALRDSHYEGASPPENSLVREISFPGTIKHFKVFMKRLIDSKLLFWTSKNGVCVEVQDTVPPVPDLPIARWHIRTQLTTNPSAWAMIVAYEVGDNQSLICFYDGFNAISAPHFRPKLGEILIELATFIEENVSESGSRRMPERIRNKPTSERRFEIEDHVKLSEMGSSKFKVTGNDDKRIMSQTGGGVPMDVKAKILDLQNKSEQFLQLLFISSKGSSQTFVDIRDLLEELGWSATEYYEVEDFMEAKGIAKRMTMGGIDGSIIITPAGIRQVEKDVLGKEPMLGESFQKDSKKIPPPDYELELPLGGKYGTNRDMSLEQVQDVVRRCKNYQKRGGKVPDFYSNWHFNSGKFELETLRSWLKHPKFSSEDT